MRKIAGPTPNLDNGRITITMNHDLKRTFVEWCNTQEISLSAGIVQGIRSIVGQEPQSMYTCTIGSYEVLADAHGDPIRIVNNEVRRLAIEVITSNRKTPRLIEDGPETYMSIT